ncbi:hypothetical protein B0H14DRAFT_2587316 [Mycena olivaceomarginata]|nr:hypothetical protein B0H14DRAFT_2587316 [Mycena olivaceomarginata]
MRDVMVGVGARGILTVPYTVTTVTITVNYGSLTGRNRNRTTCPGPLYGTSQEGLRDACALSEDDASATSKSGWFPASNVLAGERWCLFYALTSVWAHTELNCVSVLPARAFCTTLLYRIGWANFLECFGPLWRLNLKSWTGNTKARA